MAEQSRFERAVRASQRVTLARRLSNGILRRLPDPVRRLLKRDRRSPIARAIAEFARSRRDVTFVQIGSCDGTTGDPIYEHVVERGWAGVVVEPVPYNFERLVESYRRAPQVTCENIAISDRAEVRPFYHVRADPSLPSWCFQIGSFDRRHLEKHAIMLPNVGAYIVSSQVKCLTLPQLIDRRGLARVDLLHTDVEGFDLHILRQVDFTRHRPALILYEDLHMADAEREEAARMLRAQGYTIVSDGMNALAS